MSIVAVFAVVSLPGCAGEYGHYDYDFRAVDAIGQWKQPGSSTPVTLDVRADGTFTAGGWPHELYCDGSIPKSGDDVLRVRDSSIGYSGTWTGDGDSAEYTVWFSSPGPECRSNWAAVAWTTAGRSPQLKIDLSPLTSSERLTKNTVLFLDRADGLG